MMNKIYTTNIIKRSLLTGMVAVTLLTSVAAPARTVFADTYDMVESNESIDMANWMRYMPNDVQLSRLNIPGSHDAGMYNADKVGTKIYYETQSINLYKQLEAGSRVKVIL